MTRSPPVPSPDRSAAETPGSSEGMPQKTPVDGRARPGQASTPADASDEASLALPHERDQSVGMTDDAPDPQVKQASKDLGRGLKDTGKGPAMDAAYNKLKSP
ncbi:MAG: hypothetical protein ACT6Q9_12780 [Polaromonas sp.]|uniref:hypothetical protein n=1 Tax=Polaromonas sp. TaxID=1869339 RepID=UPI00403616DD